MSKKVLHVLGSLNAGGVEAWLVTLLQNNDNSMTHHDFMLQKTETGFYDEQVLSLGSKIYHCQLTPNLILYSISLYRFFKMIKPDVVHSHVHAFSGFVLFIAYLAGVKTRVSHAHSDTRVVENNGTLTRRAYSKLMRKLISKFSTTQIAVSTNAAQDLYGLDWEDNNKCVILPCGIDYSKYDDKYKNPSLRFDLGIPGGAFVIGHVGRFDRPKNHSFLIDVFHEVRKKRDNAYLVLVGDGSLRPEIEEKVEKLGLTPYVIFTGLRRDVPSIMLSVFDVFIFPSLWEGLGLVAVEAQLSGLTVLASHHVPEIINCGNTIFLPLIVKRWAEALTHLNKFHSNNPDLDFTLFSIDNNLKQLSIAYQK